MLDIGEADRRLLREMQRDATLTLRELGERVGMSQSSVWRRVQEFEAAGLIAGRVTLLDPKLIGLGVCVLVHINIRVHSAESREGFERFVLGAGEVLQCYSVTGPYDYVLLVRARSVEEYEEFLMHRLLAHPAVATAHSNLALRQIKNTTALPL